MKLKITYSNQKKGDDNAGCVLNIEGSKEACLKALDEVKRQIEGEQP